VYLVATQGGAPRRLFQDFWHQLDSFQSIGWHPDGVRLSFTGSYLNKAPGFFTVRVTDGLPTASQMHKQVAQRLVIGTEMSGDMAAPPRIKLEEFRWSPSASRLFFVGSLNGLRNLWSVEVDPGTLEWRSGPYQLTSGPGSDVRPAPSADGRRIAFTTRSETTRVWVIPFDNRRGRTSGDGEPVSPSDFILKNFDLSRDGKKLAFVGVLPGASRTQLWEIALDTGERTLRLSDTVSRSFLRYSRSASALAHWVEGAPPTIRTIRASAVEEQIVAQAELNYPFDWAPDDTAIIGSSTTNSAVPWYVATWPIDAAPHAEKRVTVVLRDAHLSLWGARYSPDGKWLCFNAHAAKGNSVIGVASVSGPPDRPWSRVTNGEDWADKPRWSPDGRSLYYISSAEEGIYNLHRVGFDPQTGRTVGTPAQITSFRSPARTVSPHLADGELGVAPGRLALTILEASGSIWMLDNVDR
jgi:Tol biopolymer transport system component